MHRWRPLVHAGDMCPAPAQALAAAGRCPSRRDDQPHPHRERRLHRRSMQGHAAGERPREGAPGRADGVGGHHDLRLQHRQGGASRAAVDFEDPRLRIKSDDGAYDALGGADFDKANFQILDRNGRGYAREMSVHPDGKVRPRAGALHHLSGRQPGLDAAGLVHQPGHPNQEGVRRATCSHALQGRADLLHAVHLASRWATSARAACCFRASGTPAATAISWKSLIISISRRITT